jgi:hypothetical protein
MTRVHTLAFRLLIASLVFWSCLATGTQAQTLRHNLGEINE